MSGILRLSREAAVSMKHGFFVLCLCLCMYMCCVLTANAQTPPPPPQIPGTTTQLTSNQFEQRGPAISGNLVCYTDFRLGATLGEVFCHDIAQNVDFQITAANVAANQTLNDVSGDTVVYTETDSSGVNRVHDCVITAEVPFPCTPVLLDSSFSQSAGVDGSIVVWADNSSANFQIIAEDLSTGTLKQLTQNGGNNNSLVANVSGPNVAYSTAADLTGTSCQIYVTNFDTGTTTQVTNTIGCNDSPDINGHFVVYQSSRNAPPECATPPVAGTPNCRQIFVYDLNAGMETAVPPSSVQQNPHVSGDWVSFEDVANGTSSIRLYQISTAQLFTAVAASTNLQSAFLNDIDGFNLVYTSAASGADHIYLFQFTPPSPDFSLSPIPAITVTADSSASGTVTVNSVNGSTPQVTLSVSTPPTGVSATVVPSPVTPPSGGSATATLTVSVAPYVTPSAFTLTVTGTSGTVANSTPANVTVVATATSITGVIGNLLNAGCIDNAGIANALTSKLAAAQMDINSGNFQTAINVLTALKNQLQAQSGKHIAISCSIGGVVFNPAAVLLLDVQGLIDSLRVSAIADPITGYVVDGNGLGIAGASLTILDSSGNALATATTDITGFYVFATTGILASNAAYMLAVTGFPGAFTSSTPQADAFTWNGTGMGFNFVLN